MTSNKQQIKECITCLCTLLKNMDIFHKITPEDFRKAKYENLEVNIVFEDLIRAVLTWRLPQNKFKLLKIHDLLKSIQYHRAIHFSQETIISSKEFLILFGWLLHHFNVMEKIKDNAMEPISISKLIIEFKVLNKPTSVNAAYETKYLEGLALSEQSCYLNWLMSQIKYCNKEILYLRENVLKSIHKLEAISSKKLTEDQLLMLRNPHTLKYVQKCIERKIIVLQTLQQWWKCESVFWTWLDGILKSCKEDSRVEAFNPKNANVADDLSLIEKHFYQLKSLIERESQKQIDNNALLGPEEKNEIDREISQLKSRILAVSLQPHLVNVEKNPKFNVLSPRMQFNINYETERLKLLSETYKDQIKQLKRKYSSISESEDFLLIPQDL